MTTHTAVPSEVEAESVVDLAHDCREISGVLGSYAPTVLRLPPSRGVLPVEICRDAVEALDGYDEYGS
jgi:hypothetical protein